MSSSPHALILPYPAQSHVIPLMDVARRLVDDHGFRVTFVNTEHNHARISAAALGGQIRDGSMRLVSVPDGLGPEEDRNDFGRLCDGLVAVIPEHIKEIIQTSSEAENGKITCMIADNNMAFALEVARETGVRAAAFWPAATSLLATIMSIPKLIEDGVLDDDGMPKRDEMIKLGPGLPPMATSEFPWTNIGDSKTAEIIFRFINNNTKASELAEFIVCNSFHELESPVFTYVPALLPIGPLTTGRQLGHFWPEDVACIDWLDRQRDKSVVYVAFGSFTTLDKDQFQELALGLELLNRPFLWVVRPGLTRGAYPTGFKERVADRGMIIDWCPQQRVLAHPSVACFFSHCGWNSTIEGVRHGVPFLCLPYFYDQFSNQRYICDVWKIGIRMSFDEDGMISRKKVKEKVEELLEDKGVKERSLMWKEIATISVVKGGSSYKNFHKFVTAMNLANQA